LFPVTNALKPIEGEGRKISEKFFREGSFTQNVMVNQFPLLSISILSDNSPTSFSEVMLFGESGGY
jgi:hypothetical protein